MRRECPHEDCGAGIFMAQHFDRQYCGKCHLTYMFKKDEE
jgi:small subunit ribosomal protein S27Ae